ncbi:MAG: discoidin domain-containing protein, partial [Thermoplasmata archaeon]|nr:discoidin domain-containing protein [Thermoplasmata archaeon]
SMSEFDMNLAGTHEKILDYVRSGGMFVFMCPNINMDIFGVHHVSGWRNDNVKIVDQDHPLSYLRSGESPNYWSASETNGYWTNWEDDGFHLIFADTSNPENYGVTLEKKMGRGTLILDAHEPGYPANTAGNWKARNLIHYATQFAAYTNRVYDPVHNAQARLSWLMNGTTHENETRYYSIYFNVVKGDRIEEEYEKEEYPFRDVHVLDDHVNATEEVQITFRYREETDYTEYFLFYSFDSSGTLEDGNWSCADIIEAGKEDPATAGWSKGYWWEYTYGLKPVAENLGAYDSAHSGYASYGSSMPPNGFYGNDILFFDGYRYNTYVDTVKWAAAAGHMVIVDYYTFSNVLVDVKHAGIKSFSSRGYSSNFIYYGGGVIVDGDQDNDGYLSYDWRYYSDTAKQDLAAHFRDLYDSVFIFKAILPKAGKTTTAYFLVSAYDSLNNTFDNSSIYSYYVDGDVPIMFNITDLSMGPELYVADPLDLRAEVNDIGQVDTVTVHYTYDAPGREGAVWEEMEMEGSELFNTTLFATVTESSHPYENNQNIWHNLSDPGAYAMRVHFTTINLEQDMDHLEIYDSNGALVARYTGYNADLQTDWIPGDEVRLFLTTDSSVNGWGYHSDMYESHRTYAVHIDHDRAMGSIPYTDTFTYYITATDLSGNTASSGTFTANMDSPPFIGEPVISPEFPNAEDDVTVTVPVEDHEGVEEVVLWYIEKGHESMNIATPAHGTTATSNNYHSDQFAPEYAIDGFGEDGVNQTHYWLTSNWPSGAYLQLNFDRVYVIDHARLLNTRNAQYYDRSTLNFRLGVSTDGKSFDIVHSGTLTEDDIINWYDAVFTPSNCMYLRFYVDSYT